MIDLLRDGSSLFQVLLLIVASTVPEAPQDPLETALLVPFALYLGQHDNGLLYLLLGGHGI